MGKHEYDISLFSSAVRPDMWMDVYKTWMKNSASIEVVFVGDKYPSYELPSNFKFIYSEVKPAQCFEAAARNCSGKYVAMVSDDCFHEDGYFDSMLKFHNKQVKDHKTKKVITGGRHYFGFNTKRRVCRLWPGNARPNQEIPMDFFLTRKLYKEMGGLDRNFISLVHHWDLMMRVMEAGGKCALSKDKFYEVHRDGIAHEELSSITGRIDKKYFHSLWFSRWGEEYSNKREFRSNKESIDYYTYNGKGYIPKNRRKEFEPFSDEDILTVSQGPVHGKWDVKVGVE